MEHGPERAPALLGPPAPHWQPHVAALVLKAVLLCSLWAGAGVIFMGKCGLSIFSVPVAWGMLCLCDDFGINVLRT